MESRRLGSGHTRCSAVLVILVRDDTSTRPSLYIASAHFDIKPKLFIGYRPLTGGILEVVK